MTDRIRRMRDIATGTPIVIGLEKLRIAVDTLEISNGVDVPSILAERLKEKTGFDILEATDESDLPYIPKEVKLL